MLNPDLGRNDRQGRQWAVRVGRGRYGEDRESSHSSPLDYADFLVPDPASLNRPDVRRYGRWAATRSGQRVKRWTSDRSGPYPGCPFGPPIPTGDRRGAGYLHDMQRDGHAGCHADEDLGRNIPHKPCKAPDSMIGKNCPEDQIPNQPS